MFVVRRYEPKDRAAVRGICCETALMGEPASAFFDDNEVLADALTGYYTDYEPGSSFVAEDGGRIVGYLIGSLDIEKMEKIFAARIAAPLLAKAIRRGVFLNRKSSRFIFNILAGMATGEFSAPRFRKDYPATLHINILKEHRRAGIGRMLVGAYLDHLRSYGAAGVHFATMSEKAGEFFSSIGFRLLHQGRRSYFRHLLGRVCPVYIYGMKRDEICRLLDGES